MRAGHVSRQCGRAGPPASLSFGVSRGSAMAASQDHRRLRRRIQIGVTVFGALLTTAVAVFDALQIELPRYSLISDWVFDIYVLVTAPLRLIGQAVSFESHSTLLSDLLMVGINTAIFFVLGSGVGWFAVLIMHWNKRQLSREAPAKDS